MPTAMAHVVADTDWISVPEAVRRSGLMRPTILARALTGDIKVRSFGDRLWVNAETLDAYQSRAAKSS